MIAKASDEDPETAKDHSACETTASSTDFLHLNHPSHREIMSESFKLFFSS
jgi:hypothetical protein